MRTVKQADIKVLDIFPNGVLMKNPSSTSATYLVYDKVLKLTIGWTKEKIENIKLTVWT